MKHLLLTTIAAVVMLLFGGVNEVNADPLTYEVVGDFNENDNRLRTVTIIYCRPTASGALVIPSTYEGKPVTHIGSDAFWNCTNLTSVTIPDSVTGIGSNAFRRCSSLTSVTIPDSVTFFGYWVFQNCSGLTSVTIGNNVTRIGSDAFIGCSSLTSIEVGKGNTEYTSVNGVLFDKNKNSLIQFPAEKSGHYTIPDSVTNIGNYAFRNCSSLTSVRIGNSVTSIGYQAFHGCRSLTSVTIPDSVITIGYWAFSDCRSLTIIEVGKGNTEYLSEDGVLFDKNKTELIQFPAGKSGHYTIPDSVTSIEQAFHGCSSLTSVTIPDSVTSIGNHAFQYCSNLTSVTIGNSVTSIGSYAFNPCFSLTRIIFEGNAPSIGLDVFSGVSEDAKIFINPGATGFGETFGGVPVLRVVTLTVASRDPDSGVTVTVSPADQNGQNDGKTQFTRFYFKGTIVTLSAVHSLGANQFFKQWLANGEPAGTGRTVTVKMDYNRTLRAVYEYIPIINFKTHTLTVASRDPDSGVTVTVSPADQNGQAGGTTQFTRVYLKGTEVTLTAKQSVGANQFKQWLANGEPVGTNPAVTVIMDYDRTLRVVYELKHEPIELKYPITTISPFTFTFSTVEGVTYEVQVTQDLKSWSILGEVKGTSGEAKFTDPRLPIVPFERNYFRVKLVE